MKNHNWKKIEISKKSWFNFWNTLVGSYVLILSFLSLFLQEKIRLKNGNVFADFYKIERFEYWKKQNFKNFCFEFLDHLIISLHIQNWHFWTSTFLKNLHFLYAKNVKKWDFPMFGCMALTKMLIDISFNNLETYWPILAIRKTVLWHISKWNSANYKIKKNLPGKMIFLKN